MTRLRFAPALLVVFLSAVPAEAQSWTLVGGPGWIEYDGSLGPAYHLDARRVLASWEEVRIGSSPVHGWRIPAVQLEGELFAQRGRSGSRVRYCAERESFCFGGADPLHLYGVGAVGRMDMLKPGGRLQLYFLPLTTTLFLQRGTVYESEIGSPERVGEHETKVVGGVGNGAGIQLRVAGVIAVAELRAIIARDLHGTRSGSLPIGIGLRW